MIILNGEVNFIPINKSLDCNFLSIEWILAS